MVDLDVPGRDLLKRQDRAALAMLRDAVERCPQALGGRDAHERVLAGRRSET